MNLYLTQDRIGTPTGGGAVTYHEYKALESLGEEIHPIDAARFAPCGHPFVFDGLFKDLIIKNDLRPRLVHIYAGCFTQTVRELHRRGAKVSYTAAAHDVEKSRKEHEALGFGFNLSHLTDPVLWKQYLGGYLEADILICPSQKSLDIMRKYGRANPVKVIAHGHDPVKAVPPLPKTFAIGYMGQAGPDKGLRYLLEAWKKLDYKDAELVIAGNNIDSVLPLWRTYGGGRLRLLGFVPALEDFYTHVSVYVQPSVTEGFGIEVLEAKAHNRRVICSDGVGAVDCLSTDRDLLFKAGDAEELARFIDHTKKVPEQIRYVVGNTYEWERVRRRYVECWSEYFSSSLGT